MRSMRVIPAIDVLNGKVVRLSQGDFDQISNYHLDPVEQAKLFESQGFTHLHLVDLDGARQGKVQHASIISEIRKKTKLVIDFGGGIKNSGDLEKVFSAGAEKVNIGSLAITEPETFSGWLRTFGGNRFILSADVRDDYVFINGWKLNSGKRIDDVISFFLDDGLRATTCTDITKDGMMSGPSTELYQNLKSKFPKLELIASGGVSTVADLLALKHAGCSAAITGKALLEGKIQVENLLKNDLTI